MNRSETPIVATIAALSLALSAGCFSSDSAGPPSQPDASTYDGTSPSSGSSSGSGDDVDAAQDATIEPETDAGRPTGMDAAAEASTTPSVDAGVDASVDASIQAVPEAGVKDAAAEAGPVEAGTVAISTNTQTIVLGDGATLFINDNHGPWSYGAATYVSYANLPAALNGTVGNDTVNTSTPVTFTLTKTTTCYLLRQDQWTAVDLTGWVAFDHAAYYFTGYDNNGFGPGTIYSQTFAAGVYNWNTYSAMYACAE